MSEIPLGLYLWRRIRQLGIESIFGVPGDFNLNFLDFIYDVEGLKWVGNANELNAAYVEVLLPMLPSELNMEYL